MKKKIFLFLVLLFMFVPFICAHAEEVSVFTINSNEIDLGIVKNGTYYGEAYNLWTTTPDIQKYDTYVSICNLDGSKCNVQSDSTHIELEPGTYKIGYRVVGKEGYEITHADKWIINGEEISPTECGSNGQNDLGCENFFTVTILDWKERITEFSFETKVDYKPGDMVDNTVKVISEKGNLVDTKIHWFKSIEDMSPDNADRAITKFENGVYYLAVEGLAEKGMYLDFGDKFYMNGKAYSAEDMYAGLGDYNYFYIGIYKLDLTNASVKEDKDVSDKTKKVLSEALDDLSAGNEIKEITEEVATKVKEAYDNGKEIRTEVLTEQIDFEKIPDEIKKAFEEKKESNQNVIGYFDINLSILAGEEELGKISELQDEIAITIDASSIVKNLPKVEDGITRIYKALRMHDGIVDVLDAKLNSNLTLTIYTDRFSNYAIIYEDVVNDINPKKGINNPQTKDNVFTDIFMFGLSINSLLGLGFYIKKKMIN